jgi:regulator of sigma E protease
MITLTNLIAFIITLGVIIFVHEAGHLMVAKAFNVRVLAFSLGFGKRLFGFQRGETDYRVSLVPLGGYVRLGGENPDEVSDDPREFLNKPRWQRILVYLAGPVMNVLLAIAFITGLFASGTSVLLTMDRVPPIAGMVLEGSPAEAAGIRPGDRIVSLDGDDVGSWQDFIMTVSLAPGRTFEVEARRGEETYTTRLTPAPAERPASGGEVGIVQQILPEVVGVVEGGPAQAAGFQPGDEITAVDGHPVGDQKTFSDRLQGHAGKEVVVTVQRDGRLIDLPVTPSPEATDAVSRGQVGISMTTSGFVQYPLGQAFVEALRWNWSMTKATLGVLGKIVTRQVKAESAMSGPIDIASFSGEALRTGPKQLIFLMALISLSIAIFNLLPIPLLDGGQIFILLLETVRGRDLSLPVKEKIQTVGFALIILLMATVLWLDISKRLPKDEEPAEREAVTAPAETPAADEEAAQDEEPRAAEGAGS